MRTRTEQEDKLVRYILSRLKAEEEAQIEEQFFADDQFFEQLLAVEDAMMDAYAQGELPEDERAGFGEYLISSSQRVRDLGFTRDLIGDVAKIRAARESGSKVFLDQPSPPPQTYSNSPAFFYALAAFLLVGGLSVYLIVSNSSLHKKLQQLQAEITALENGQQTPGNKNASRFPQPDLTASLVLSSTNLTRGGGAITTVELSPRVRHLRIQIELPNEPGQAGHLVTIVTAGGEEAWAGIALPEQVDSGNLNIFIPAEKFKDDVYTLKLERLTEDNQVAYVGEYAFRVKR